MWFCQVHNLDKAQLKDRTVTRLDIVNPIPESPDPTTFHSEKANRGPLEKGWIATANPIMCAYKLIGVNFKYFGLQTRVENFILSVRIFSW